MRTARLTVLLEPDAKAAIEARAAALKLSASELVRRAVDLYDPAADPEALQAVADELAGAVARIEDKLEALDALYARVDRLPERREALRAEARAALAADNAVWPIAV
jgi:hypothetical protein